MNDVGKVWQGSHFPVMEARLALSNRLVRHGRSTGTFLSFLADFGGFTFLIALIAGSLGRFYNSRAFRRDVAAEVWLKQTSLNPEEMQKCKSFRAKFETDEAAEIDQDDVDILTTVSLHKSKL